MVKTRQPAPHKPVARVLPLLGVSVLDQFYEYQVDTDLDAQVQPGVRVRVRFHHRLIDAIVLDRVATPEFDGQLAWIDRVVGPDVVYPPHIRRLVETLATRYAGTTADVIRAAIPPRHARSEDTDTTTPWDELGSAQEPDLSAWAAYEHGQSFVDAVLSGVVARAAWQILPGESWARAIAALVAKVAMDGRGALVVLPNQREVDLVEAALREVLSAKQITVLTAQQGPQARYRRYVSILRGQARVVIGTRNAAFAPLKNLGLLVIKDDGDTNLVEPLAPYMHTREVLTTRSSIEKASLVIASHTRTAETQLLVESGWMHSLCASRDVVRSRSPLMRAAGDSDAALERDPGARAARLPAVAFQALREGLNRGLPVLVQVPRKGYIPTIACQKCRTPARCRHCHGPMAIPEGTAAAPSCRWCGTIDTHYRCLECGSRSIRAVILGSDRTAEELGRAFPQTKVVVSGGNKVIASVPQEPAIVVATHGAEPVATYGACVLLDAWVLLGRQDLRAMEDSLATWVRAAAMVQSHAVGGQVVVVADPALPVVQRLLRWDVVGAAATELAQRRELHFPPAALCAVVDGPVRALKEFKAQVELPSHAEVLGPVDLPPGVRLPAHYDNPEFGPAQRLLIRAPLGPRLELGRALKHAQVQRAVSKSPAPVRIQVDPVRFG